MQDQSGSLENEQDSAGEEEREPYVKIICKKCKTITIGLKSRLSEKKCKLCGGEYELFKE